MKKTVYSGIDRLSLVEKQLQHKRVGLMTNPTGINRKCKSTVDMIHSQFELGALFAGEHGLRGDAQAGAKIETYTDPETNTPVYSLYGKQYHMNDEMLDRFDVFVFDMQDVGARFYTYLYSLAYVMEDCAKANKPFILLDRINPIGGVKTSGTILNPKFHSFVGEYAIPTQYGLTIGEYGQFIKDHLKLDLDLTVVPLEGWQRHMYLDDTDLPWVAPSPNCQALSTALCYVGTCIFEGTNLSEGRGTTLPFEVIGAPWVDARALERYMNNLNIPGIIFRRTYFTPVFSKHANTLCHGVQMHIMDREKANAFNGGLMLLDGIKKLFPEDFEWLHNEKENSYFADKLLGTDEYRIGALTAQELIDKYAPLVMAFSEETKPFQLY